MYNEGDYSSAWELCRLMGGFVYGGDDSNKGDSFRWRVIAGKFTDSKEFILSLGISEEDYKYLRYMVRLQNQIASSDNNLSFSSISSDLSTYREKYIQATGEEVTNEQFMEIWDDLYANMAGKSYYNGIAADLAGWLGDAILIPGDSKVPSFGADDYMADLDAENIVHMMKSKDLPYIDAYMQYYDSIEAGASRAEMFLEHTSIEFVKDKICDSFFFEAIKSCDDINDLKNHAPDAYNFILNLEVANIEMEELHIAED